MIQGLCDKQAEFIIEIKLGNAYADSYNYDPMEVPTGPVGNNQEG